MSCALRIPIRLTLVWNDTIYKQSEAIFHRLFFAFLCLCILYSPKIVYTNTISMKSHHNRRFAESKNKQKKRAAQCSIANGTRIAGKRFKEFGGSSVYLFHVCRICLYCQGIFARSCVGHFIEIYRLSFTLMLEITYLPSHEYAIRQKYY